MQAGRSALSYGSFRKYTDPVQSASVEPVQELEIIDNDIKKWRELTNLLSIGGQISRLAHSRNLKRQLDTANELITLIRKEYHLR
jgi:hypothetical protein